MILNDLIQEINSFREVNLPIFGSGVDFCFPIYHVMPSCDFMLLGMLYKSPWENAAWHTRKFGKSLMRYVEKTDLLPRKGGSKVYLSLDFYNFDYSMTIKYYEVVDVDFRDDRFLIVGKVEDSELRRNYPVDPHLLKMQRDEPTNSIYFPYRPGFDDV